MKTVFKNYSSLVEAFLDGATVGTSNKMVINTDGERTYLNEKDHWNRFVLAPDNASFWYNVSCIKFNTGQLFIPANTRYDRTQNRVQGMLYHHLHKRHVEGVGLSGRNYHDYPERYNYSISINQFVEPTWGVGGVHGIILPVGSSLPEGVERVDDPFSRLSFYNGTIQNEEEYKERNLKEFVSYIDVEQNIVTDKYAEYELEVVPEIVSVFRYTANPLGIPTPDHIKMYRVSIPNSYGTHTIYVRKENGVWNYLPEKDEELQDLFLSSKLLNKLAQ